MKKQIATLVFIIITTISFAGGGIPNYSIPNADIKKTGNLITNRVPVDMNVVLPLIETRGILNDSNNKVYKNPNPQEGNNWISKTISVFGGGFNLAGFNIKMNEFDLVKKSGWVDKKEWNLHADKTRNGLSLKYKF